MTIRQILPATSTASVAGLHDTMLTTFIHQQVIARKRT